MTFALLLLQQGPRVRAPKKPVSDAQVQNADAVATFDGTFKSADKKFVQIEVENGQTMQMYITGRTKFVRDGKPAKAAEFQNGEAVTVETARDARFNLIAVKVETAKKQERQPEK